MHSPHDTPEPAPPPGMLSDMTARRAWDEDVSDQCRQLHEWNADTVRAQNVLIGRLRCEKEHLEAEVATYVAILYGPQKGGAS